MAPAVAANFPFSLRGAGSADCVASDPHLLGDACTSQMGSSSRPAVEQST